MRLLALLVALALAGLANLAVWYLPNRPVPLEPPPGGKLASVSFAPFRDGQSPLTGVLPTPTQIDQDLAAIAPQVAGIRTYTSLEGLQIVPELARKHGLTVTMGAWLSGRLDKNEQEVASIIDLANRYPDVITRLIVGNEVLLRRDLTPEQVTGYIDRVRAAVRQPVSYADVWEWWLKYPQIADHVDFLTIHLLPYWEDVPAGVEGANERIRTSYRAIAARFPGKPILVGETGWPTAGRSRGAAATGLVEKARFVNGFVRLAAQEGFDYNVIEAFDQNWKQKLEGTVGGHWGLYATDRTAKFSLAGPVVENPAWPALFAVSTVLAAGLLAMVAMPALPISAAGFFALSFLATALSTAFVRAADRAWHWNYYWHNQAIGWVLLALEAVVIVAVLHAARRALSARVLELEGLVPIVAAAGTSGLRRLGAAAALGLAVIAVAWSGMLILNGRYVNFPNPDLLVPAIALTGLGLIRAARRPASTAPAAAFAAGSLFGRAVPVSDAPRRLPVEAALAALLVLGAFGTVVAEGVVPLESLIYGQLPFMEALHEVDWTQPNWEALAWALIQLVLAVPFLAAVRTARARPAQG